MGKKNQPKNAFYFFMLEYQRVHSKRGQNFPNGLRDVQEDAGEEWKRMGPEQRKPFEDMSIRAKGRNGGEKYTTQGQSFSDLEREQQEAKDRDALMLKTIQDMLIQLGRNTGLATGPFFFIHINWFCKKDDGTYYPAELALSKYSILEGSSPILHTFVDFEPLPLGYNFKAQTHSKDTHKIPLPELPEDLNPVTSRAVLFDSIIDYVRKYIEPDERIPPFFTLPKEVDPAANMLGRIAAENGETDRDFFRVYPLDRLFFDMKNFGLKPEEERVYIRGTVDNGWPYLSLATNLLRVDEYCYRFNIACDYHIREDVGPFCSKSMVKRWGWTFSNHLCRNLDIQMRPGVHCPQETIPQELTMTNSGRLNNARGTSRAAGRGTLINDNLGSEGRGVLSRSRSVSQSVESIVNGFGSPVKVGKPVANAWAVPEQFDDLPATSRTATQMARSDMVPLREPKTKSVAMMLTANDSAAAFNFSDFPAIGSARNARGNRGGAMHLADSSGVEGFSGLSLGRGYPRPPPEEFVGRGRGRGQPRKHNEVMSDLQ